MNTLETKIKKWLLDSGYPLELYVHKSLKSRSFGGNGAAFYEDPDTGIQREIDNVSSRSSSNSGRFTAELQTVIECKKSDNPIVLLSTAKESISLAEWWLGKSLIHDIVNGKNEAKADLFVSRMEMVEIQQTFKKFAEPIVEGYALKQAFTKTDTNIYKGLMGVVKAFSYFHSKHENLVTENKNEFIQEPYYKFIVPILVIDSPFVRATLGEDSELEIDSIEWGTISIDNTWSVIGPPVVHVHIVQKNSFNEFIDNLINFHEFISSDEIVYIADSKLMKLL